MKKYDAFVSYSHLDRDIVKPVVALLSIRDRRVFWDQQSIRPGERFSRSITDAIHNSARVVVLWCCHSAQSTWVEAETAIAVKADKPVAPVMLCRFPLRPPLDQYQRIDFANVIRHDCSGHAEEESAPTDRLEVMSLLRDGVGLKSMEPQHVTAKWNELVTSHRAISSIDIRNFLTGATLLILAFIRPFPNLLAVWLPEAEWLLNLPPSVNLLSFAVGASLIAHSGRGNVLQYFRRRLALRANDRAKLLALTIESIVQLGERGQLSRSV